MAEPAKPVIDPLVAREEMLNLFEQKVTELTENTDYYESNHRPKAIGIATPPEFRDLLANIGYPRLYVNALADRLELEGFRIADTDADDDTYWQWWQANDLDIESTLGHVDSLVHGRAYITVAAPDPAVDIDWDPTVPIIRVEPPTNLYAKIDPRTRKVEMAIRAVYNDAGDTITAATLYLPEQTILWVKVDGEWDAGTAIPHNLGIVPVIPIANRTRLSDLYGTSDITPELRSVTDAAGRILMNMQATAELMAVPLRVLFGVKRTELGLSDDPDEPSDPRAAFEAYYARILAFEDPEGSAQQFSAAELRNFTDALDALDKKAAAYTGLPPQYLSTQSDTPASAEAIKASEARLVKNAERKCKLFGGAWEQAMRVASKVMKQEITPAMLRMETVWRDPSTPTYAAKADAATKLYNGGAGVVPKEQARIDMGYSSETRKKMTEWDASENPVGQLAGMYAPPPTPGGAKPKAAPNEKPPAPKAEAA